MLRREHVEGKPGKGSSPTHTAGASRSAREIAAFPPTMSRRSTGGRCVRSSEEEPRGVENWSGSHEGSPTWPVRGSRPIRAAGVGCRTRLPRVSLPLESALSGAWWRRPATTQLRVARADGITSSTGHATVRRSAAVSHLAVTASRASVYGVVAAAKALRERDPAPRRRRLVLVGVQLGDDLLERARREDVAVEKQEILVRDRLGVLEPRKRAVLGLVREGGRW